MRHDPLVCVEDAIKACVLISQFIRGMRKEDFYTDYRIENITWNMKRIDPFW